jgi:hypothetical protein
LRKVIEISPGIPSAGAIGTAIRPALRRRHDPFDAVRLALIAFALGLSAPAAAEESRTPAEFVAAPAVASAAHGGQLVLGAMDRSGKRWIVAAASAPDAGSSTPPAAASAPAGRYVALIIDHVVALRASLPAALLAAVAAKNSSPKRICG